MKSLDSPGTPYPLSLIPPLLELLEQMDNVNVNLNKTTILSTFKYSSILLTNDEQITKYRMDSRPQPIKRMQKAKNFNPDF